MARHYEFVEEARADFEAAVLHVMAKPPATGQAKWSCLQGVEKTLKGYLHEAGFKFPRDARRGHDLHHLAGLLEGAAGPQLEEHLIDEVHCPSDVRYESELVTGEEAARAHFAGLELAGTTALALLQRFPKQSR